MNRERRPGLGNHTGGSKWSSSKAGGEKEPEAYPLGYVEDEFDPRTKLAIIFNRRH